MSQKTFNPGDYVFFIKNGEVRYGKILKVVMSQNGYGAVFHEGCVKDYFIPMEDMFSTKQELLEGVAVNE